MVERCRTIPKSVRTSSLDRMVQRNSSPFSGAIALTFQAPVRQCASAPVRQCASAPAGHCGSENVHPRPTGAGRSAHAAAPQPRSCGASTATLACVRTASAHHATTLCPRSPGAGGSPTSSRRRQRVRAEASGEAVAANAEGQNSRSASSTATTRPAAVAAACESTHGAFAAPWARTPVR
jgi:hypothetical protein